MRRALLRLVVVAALGAVAALVPVSGSTPAATAHAANMALFDAGNIISDAVFFDSRSMDAVAIQGFLNSKGGSCTAGSLCLKNYTVSTTNRAGDQFCPAGYTGVDNESAAQIIAKAAVSCRVSPRVLLVLLQKEQGLVTGSPTAAKYVRAAGFACPDSANGECDPAYAGLQNQVYNSARQYQRYAAGILNNYKPGMTHDILWSPNTSCGTSKVFVANQATAGLYDYTPYRPTQAALNSGPAGVPKSSADYGCATYGNRNFWTYFTDWFGSTQSLGGNAVMDRYYALGGVDSDLGATTGYTVCGLIRSGCYQTYERGAIYWSPGTGAHVLRNAIRDKWSSLNWELGPLGYPVTDETCGLADGGCRQEFESGSVTWSPSAGTHAVLNAIQGRWNGNGAQSGMGYPVMDEYCGLRNGGCWQDFERGAVYWSPSTGAHAVANAIRASWAANGWENGTLGVPSDEEVCGLAAGGCRQSFQGGVVVWSPTADAWPVRGAILGRWSEQGSEGGPLGYPQAAQTCPTGAGGCTQTFAGGLVSQVTGATTAYTVTGDFLALYQRLGAVSGPLGSATEQQVCQLAKDGCRQGFQRGGVYATATTGAHAVVNAIRDAWGRTGWENGTLGFPAGDEVCGLSDGGCSQTFERGVIHWSPAGGAWPVVNGFRDLWSASGYQAGPLGYPTSAETCGLRNGGCRQGFEHGGSYWSPATGAHGVINAIRDAWAATGWENGSLGYPRTDERCGLTGGGCRQDFDGGAVLWSAAGAAHPVSGPIRSAWEGSGAEGGPLGYPVSDPRPVAQGTQQAFQFGTLTLDKATGKVTQS